MSPGLSGSQSVARRQSLPSTGINPMRRAAYLAYGVICYLMFFAVFVYAIGFIGNILVPNSLDGEPNLPWMTAVAANMGLLGLFAIQHSVMARPTFKRWWTKIVPEPLERSTYVLFSNLAMIAIFAFWQPIGGVVWTVPCIYGQVTMYTLYGLGWFTVFYTTCLLNHFELFGLRQVWLYYRDEPYTQLPFNEPSLYRYVRHPLYVGWLMVFWFTPTMTVSHLFFAVGTTAYILIAIRLEERNLQDGLPGHAAYKKRVPMLVPSLRKMFGTGRNSGHLPASD
jgi:protein-S-isoprenylcysteine O-methyltransferase Ste14